MNNLYYIEHDNLILIKEKIKQINKEQKYVEIYYDYKDKDIDEIIEQLDTYSFIDPNKLIVLCSCTFLEQQKKDEEKNFERLKKYLTNPNPDNILVLVNNKISDKSAITKILKKNAKQINVEIDLKELVKKELDGYQYDFNFINTLLYYTNNDIDITMSEINKLKVLKLEEKKLTKEDVEQTVRRVIDDSSQVFFSLIDNIINKNIKKSLEIYHDLKEMNIEEIMIISTLASQLRLMYQVKCLEGYTDKDIADKLKVKPYPVKKAKERGYYYTKDQLKKLILELADIDLQIKTSDIDKSLALEMFIYKQK